MQQHPETGFVTSVTMQNGDVHAANGAPFSEHSYVAPAPASGDTNVKLAFALPTAPIGPPKQRPLA